MEAFEKREENHLRRDSLERENEKNGKETGWSQTRTAASEPEI